MGGLLFYITVAILYERSAVGNPETGFADAALCNFIDGTVSMKPVQCVRYVNIIIMIGFAIWYWFGARGSLGLIVSTFIPAATAWFEAYKQFCPSANKAKLTEQHFNDAVKVVGSKGIEPGVGSFTTLSDKNALISYNRILKKHILNGNVGAVAGEQSRASCCLTTARMLRECVPFFILTVTILQIIMNGKEAGAVGAGKKLLDDLCTRSTLR